MFRDDISLQMAAYAAILVIPLVYLVWRGIRSWQQGGANRASSDPNRVSDDTSVPDASTATNFQLASVYPNVSFGASGFLVIPLFNMFGFLIGNFLTERRLPSILAAVAKYKSPHRFIALAHDIEGLQRFTACISVLVFVAIATFEMVFLAKVGSEVTNTGQNGYFGFVFCIVVLTALSVFLGGQYASITSDRWLLPIAYVGIHLAIAAVLFSGKPKPLDIASLIAVAMLGAMLVIRCRVALRLGVAASVRHWIIALSTAILFFALLFGVWSSQFVVSSDTLPKLVASFSPATSGLSSLVYVVALLAALSPALFYNFVDFSFWQKYLIEHQRIPDINELVLRARRPFWLYLFESPLTLLLPVLLGVYAVGEVAANANDLATSPISPIITFLAKQEVAGIYLAGLLFLSLSAIACSTSSSYLAALCDLWARDIASKAAPAATTFSVGSKYAPIIAIIMLVVLIPIDMIAKTTDQLILLMLTSLAPLGALTPHVIWPLFRGVDLRLSRAGKVGVTSALIAGCLLGWGLGIAGTIKGVGPDTILFWLPMPLAFLMSWFIYIISCLFLRRPI